MTTKNAQESLDKLAALLDFAAADVEAAIEDATEGGDQKAYFAALQRLDVATRAAVQATVLIANIANIQTELAKK